MRSLIVLMKWEGLILLGGFCAVVVWKLLTGQIVLEGLLQGDRLNGSTYTSAGRVQLLLFTLLPAMYYLLQVLQNPQAFPDVPDDLVKVIAVSHATYLGGKADAMLGLFRKVH